MESIKLERLSAFAPHSDPCALELHREMEELKKKIRTVYTMSSEDGVFGVFSSPQAAIASLRHHIESIELASKPWKRLKKTKEKYMAKVMGQFDDDTRPVLERFERSKRSAKFETWGGQYTLTQYQVRDE